MSETPVMVRTSERTMFTKCRQAWWWSYVERRRPVEGWSAALTFGTMIHRALAAYYIPETRKERRRGPHPAQSFVKLYDIMDANGRAFNVRTDDEVWIDALDLGVEMLENYIDQWKQEDRDILVLYPEMPFQYIVRDPATKEILCVYVGETDVLVRNLRTGRLGLMEHKTAGIIDTGHLFLDEQAGSYWTILPKWLVEQGVVKKDDNLDFMLYNYLRKAEKDERPRNSAGQYLNLPTVEVLKAALLEADPQASVRGAKREDLLDMLKGHGINGLLLGEPSKHQPPPLFHRELIFRTQAERRSTMQRIHEQVTEMNLVRAGKMPHYKAPSKDCRFCEWRDICEIHEQGNDWKELKRMTTKKWDPYAAHIWDIELEAS